MQTRNQLLLPILLCLSWLTVSAAETTPAAPFHPAFALLDQQGYNVLASGAAVSPMRTCGQCHDTQYIAEHSFHASAGAGERLEPAGLAALRAWDTGLGLAGRWDPLTYVPPAGSAASAPQASAAWQSQLGFRHVGGGPGLALAGNQAEMNCFLCHMQEADNVSRITELEQGRFAWAATATLSRSGIVRRTAAGWKWDAAAFETDGKLAAARIKLGQPGSANCGLCHGLVHDAAAPLALSYGLRNWSTETTGQVYSAQRLNASALNLAAKDNLTRPWDIHAERLLDCADCHYALNNPAASREAQDTKPVHVLYDPRRLSPGQYLQRPRHGFAKGDSAQGLVAPEADRTMRGCDDCHDAERTHRAWLPYVKRHVRALSCEACHIPQVYVPARSVTDWTMLTAAGGPRVEYRGSAEGMEPQAGQFPADTVLAGYQPVLLPRTSPDGTRQLLPYNIITSYYWVGEQAAAGEAHEAAQPVPRATLQQAFLPHGAYAASLLAVLDADGDRVLSSAELKLDAPEKVQVAARLLEACGVSQPRIMCEVAPYDIHHGVATAQWAVKSCGDCHGAESRITSALSLGSIVAPGTSPAQVGAASVVLAGEIRHNLDGLAFAPSTATAGLYILGHDRWIAGDRIGGAAVLLALLLITGHGGLRVLIGLRRRRRGGAR